jgi:membrane protein implicated in regulation of membrane protease activity
VIDMALTWWLWLLAGCALLALELLTPGGFYIFFFGIGAIVIALLSVSGLLVSATGQWLLFALISVVLLLAFRKPMQRKLSVADRGIDSMIGESARAMEEIGVAGLGKAELRGTVWTARNSGERSIVAGERCRVERIEGLTLYVRGA